MKTSSLKPFLKWAGSKLDEIPSFQSYIPDKFDTYVEPFVGGGSVFFHINFKGKKVINDAHEHMVCLYNCIKNGNAKQVSDMCEGWGNNEDTYYHIRDKFTPTCEVEKAAAFFFRSKTCFRGMTRYNSKGKFNIPFGRYKTVNFRTILDKGYEDYLRDTEIRNDDFADVMGDHINNPECFIFLDPPYDSEFKNYYLDFGREKHTQLAKLIDESKAKVLCIIAETPFIKECYGKNILGSYGKKYRFRIKENRVSDEQLNKNHLIIGKNI